MTISSRSRKFQSWDQTFACELLQDKSGVVSEEKNFIFSAHSKPACDSFTFETEHVKPSRRPSRHSLRCHKDLDEVTLQKFSFQPTKFESYFLEIAKRVIKIGRVTQRSEMSWFEGSDGSVPVRHLKFSSKHTWKSSHPKTREKNSCLLRVGESGCLIGRRVPLTVATVTCNPSCHQRRQGRGASAGPGCEPRGGRLTPASLQRPQPQHAPVVCEVSAE